MTGYFARHWRGELSLPVSYWINGGLLSLPVAAVVPWADRMAASQSLRIGALIGLAGLAWFFLFWIWSSVGIWRSAGEHTRRGGWLLWSILARLIIGLGALGMIGMLVTTGPVIKDQALLAMGQDPMGNVDVKVSPDRGTVIVTGKLRAGTVELVKAALASAPDARTIALDSSGGRMQEAVALARLVRERQLDTYVEKQCSGACAFVFVAGLERAATASAKIGFQPPGVAALNPMAQRETQARLISGYRAAGLQDAFVERVAASREGWYPTHQELVDARVVTRVTVAADTPAAAMKRKVKGVESKDELEQLVKDMPLFQAYEGRFPGSLPLVVERGWQASEDGGSKADAIAAMRAVIAGAMPKLLATASDDLLDRFVVLYIAEMSAARSYGGEVCQKVIDDKFDVSATLTHLADQEQAVMTALLAAKPRGGRVNRNEAAAMIATTMRALPIEHARVMHNVQAYASQPDKVCEASIYFYRMIQSLPEAQRHLAQRGLFQNG